MMTMDATASTFRRCFLMLLTACVLGANAALSQGALSISNQPPSTGGAGTPGGATFDIIAGANGITVWRVGAARTAATTAPIDVQVTYRLGGWSTVYPPTDNTDMAPSGWTDLGLTQVDFPVAHTLVQIPVNLNFAIPAGQRLGVCVRMTSGNISYATLTTASYPQVVTNTTASLDTYGVGGTVNAAVGGPGINGTNFPRGAIAGAWYDITQMPGTHLELTSIGLTGGNRIAVGNNTVEAVVQNLGTTSLSSTSFTLEYSTDGGTTWPTAQSQTYNLPNFAPLAFQTLTFTTPWVTTAIDTRELRVRINPPIGQGVALRTRAFVPDLDLEAVTTSPTTPALNVPMTVSFTARNNGAWGHNGQSFQARYSTNGTTWTPQTFTPSTLATANSTESFTFTTPFTLTTPGTYNLVVQIFPQVVGDPDTSDSRTLLLDNVGVPFLQFGTSTQASTLGPPVYRGSSLTGAGNYSVYQMLYTPAHLTGLPAGVTMRNIGFNKANDTHTIPGQSHPLRVWLQNTTAVDLVGAETIGTFAQNSGSLVIDNPNFVFPSSIGWVSFGPFTTTTPFVYAGDSLLVTVEWVSTGPTSTTGGTGTFSWAYDTQANPPATGRGYFTTSATPPAAATSVTLSGSSSSVRKPHARFYYDTPGSTDLDLQAVHYGASSNPAPGIGNNTVNVVVRNGASAAYTGTFNLQYSIDNGGSWVSNPAYTASGLTNTGDTQTVSFVTPWSVAAATGNAIRVRIFPQPTGDPDTSDELSRTYTPIAAPQNATASPAPLQLAQPITVGFTAKNTGTFNLNGVAFTARYTINGTNFVSQQFTPTTLATTDATETYTFTTPLVITTPGNYVVSIDFPGYAASAPATVAINDIGVPVATFGTGTTAGGSTIPLYRSGTTSTNHYSASMMLYTAADLPQLPANTVIESVAFYKDNAFGSTPTASNNILKVWLRNTTATAYTANEPFGTWDAGATLVVDKTDFAMPNVAGWTNFGPFNTSNQFTYTGASLEVLVYWDCSSGTTPWSEGAFNWRYDTYVGGSATNSRARNFNSASQPTATSSLGTTTVSSSTRIPHFRIGYETPDNPGIATSVGIVPVLDEGTVQLGQTLSAAFSNVLNVTVSNNGFTNALSVTSATVLNPVGCTASVTSFPATVAARSNGTIALSVNPIVGPYSFSLRVINNSARAAHQTYDVHFVGTGFVNTPPVIAPATAAASTILITEVTSDQSTLPTTGSEYVELTNVSPNPVNIAGWRIYIYELLTGAVYSGFPVTLVGAVIPPGGTYTLVDSGFTVPPGEVLGENILWNAGASGGVVIVDTNNTIIDGMFFGNLNPAVVQVPLPTPVLNMVGQWNGPAINALVVTQSSFKRTGDIDTNSAADWAQTTGHSMGLVNAGLSLAFPDGNLQVSGTHPNFTIGAVSGSLLTFAVEATDIDVTQSASITISVATGGTITPAQAGFTTQFPLTIPAGPTPLLAVLRGVAATQGTVNFTATVTDTSAIVGSSSINLSFKVGARLDVSGLSVESTFVRTNGQKDFYRGQVSMPVQLRFSNPNAQAIVVTGINAVAVDRVTGAPITGIQITPVGLPATILGNASNVLVNATMDIAANAGGSPTQACEIRIEGILAEDAVNPGTNPVFTKVVAPAEPFMLFDGPAPQPLVITQTTLATAVETAPYLQSLAVTGGSGNYTWSVAATSPSQLPTGLVLDPVGSAAIPAKISGTPAVGTSVPGTYVLLLQVTDGAYVDTQSITLTVTAITPLAFPPVTLASGQEFLAYSMTTPFSASGGSLMYTFSVDPSSVDQLPAGLVLNPVTGVISGTPADGSQKTYSIVFVVDDGLSQLTQTQTLVINPHPLQWRGTTLPTAVQTVSYSEALDAIGGTGPRIYSIVSGTLPNGLSLNASNGVILGIPSLTPNSVGTYNMVFKVTDGLNASVNQAITITVVPAPPLVVTTSVLEYGMVGATYASAIAVTGGSQSYVISVASSSAAQLPAGLTLAPNGDITGTPDVGSDGRYAIDISVNDGFQTITETVILPVLNDGARGVAITEVSAGAGYIELANSEQTPVDVSGWSITVWVDGTSPINLPFDSIPGASLALPAEVVTITLGGTAGGFWPSYNTGGTWTGTSTSNISVLLSDIHGNTIDFVSFGTANRASLVDSANAAIDLPAPLDTMANANNGAANYSYNGTAWVGSANGTPGVYNTGLAAFPLMIIKDALRTANSGQPFSDFTLAIGGRAPYAFTLTAPAAPWLSLSTNGVFSGTAPTVATPTTINVDVTVTDALTAAVTETFEIRIAPASTTPSATFTVGNAEGQSFEGTVIDVPVTMTRASGVTDVQGFSFVIELAAPTALELDVVRVLPGPAVIAAGRTVVARDLGNNRIFIGDYGADNLPAANFADGVVAIVRFMVPVDNNVMAPEATYGVSIADTEIGRAATGVHTATGVNGSMVLSNYKPQDVNRDTAIDVVDVQQTVNIILSLFTPTYPGQGDANSDNAVDVVDVQTIVNCILLGGC